MIDLTRRDLLASLAALGVTFSFESADAAEALTFAEARPYSFDRLVEETKALAAAPYVPEVPRFGDVIERIDYDQHQRIQYRPENTLEANEGLAPIRFFFLGRYFKMPVGINIASLLLEAGSQLDLLSGFAALLHVQVKVST